MQGARPWLGLGPLWKVLKEDGGKGLSVPSGSQPQSMRWGCPLHQALPQESSPLEGLTCS